MLLNPMYELEALGPCGYPLPFMQAIEARLGQGPVGLMVISIDNLMMIINGYGISVAEQVMGELRGLISARLPGSAYVARVQRDQFAVVMEGDGCAHLPELAQQLQSEIRRYSHASAFGALHFLATIRQLVVMQEVRSSEELLARVLMQFFDTGDLESDTATAQELSREEMGVASYLTQAISENRLRFAFQPIIDSKTGAIAHYEALLRLTTSEGKITSAGALIPVAERMGLIPLIDAQTLRMTVQELRAHPSVVLAFNVSNLTTHDAGWLAQITEYINETPDIGPRMIIELTETAIHRDLKHAAFFCAQLQALGCQIALDDFGSGYTSFRQLKALSMDMVKIDGAFVRDVMDNSDNRFFVKTLLDFTHGFGLKSVAEFVENGETAKLMMEMGVDYLQGYYFGKPVIQRKWLDDGEYARD
jgi:EAL domain-containing protein (putative c-di-GMP-specific phosphodiesterase class I)